MAAGAASAGGDEIDRFIKDISSPAWKSPALRSAALRALVDLNDPRTIPQLKAFLDDTDPVIRNKAANQLRLLGNADAFNELADAAQHGPTAADRLRAINDLADLGDPAGRDVLVPIANSDPDLSVRNAARTAVNRLAALNRGTASPLNPNPQPARGTTGGFGNPAPQPTLSPDTQARNERTDDLNSRDPQIMQAAIARALTGPYAAARSLAASSISQLPQARPAMIWSSPQFAPVRTPPASAFSVITVPPPAKTSPPSTPS